MKIKLIPKQVYGRFLWYPACARSNTLIKIKPATRKGARRAFTESDISIFFEAGLEIEFLPPALVDPGSPLKEKENKEAKEGEGKEGEM